ncbi:hypothetical protein V2K77_11245, partial [Pseudomonas alliivorans]|nr:hypothetical protein [Pseudomonas alliivorans]MEE4712285.1 hypothetical protein [Pseudomonas alliivorans]MEE4768721.1 hypothetical protein [Pseudomonas alliivorans]
HGTARQKCNGKPLPDCLAGGVYGSHTFNYSFVDAARDLATHDVIPLGAETGSVVTGGLSMASGYTLCGSGVGCVFDAPMAAFGAGNVVEGGTGIYNYFYGGGNGYNPVKEAFSLLPSP